MRVVHRGPGEEASTAEELRKSARARVAEFEEEVNKLTSAYVGRQTWQMRRPDPAQRAKRTGWLSGSTSHSTTSSWTATRSRVAKNSRGTGRGLDVIKLDIVYLRPLEGNGAG